MLFCEYNFNDKRRKISKNQNVMLEEHKFYCIPLLSAPPVEKVLVAFYFFLTTISFIGAIEDKKSQAAATVLAL